MKKNRKQERLAKYFHSTLEVIVPVDLQTVNGSWERLRPGVYEVQVLDNEDRKYSIRTYGDEIVVEETELDILIASGEATIKDGAPTYESVEEPEGDELPEGYIRVTEEVQINEDTWLEPGDVVRVLESDESSSIPDWMVKDYTERANAERRAGGSIEINTRMPTVAITMSNGEEWFFQGEEATELLDEVPYNMNEEDYILATAQDW